MGSISQAAAEGATPAPNPQGVVEALSQAALKYLEVGTLSDISGSALVQNAFELSVGSGRFYQIHEHIGSGSEGVVYYATLKGTAWGEREGSDVAIKVAHPVWPAKLQALPGWQINNEDEQASLYRAIVGQLEVLKSAGTLNHERKCAPILLEHAEFPVAGQPEAVAHIYVMEFIEGESLTHLIHEFQSGRRTDREVVSYIHQSAITLRSLLLSGVTNLDSNTDNFLVAVTDGSKPPTSIFVDFGGAQFERDIADETTRERMLSNSIDNFARNCRDIRFGPVTDLTGRADVILSNLREGAVSLTEAIRELSELLR
jgi:serine/threonine protein kinase